MALTAGEALAMRPSVFGTSILRYAQSFLTMVANISVCNRVHVIEKACMGHLLLMQDRTQSDSFPVIRDFFFSPCWE